MPDLTGITALDVAIGLALVFLLFSIVCSAAQEGIAGLFDMRAATLEAGLRNLLDDDGAAGSGGAPTAAEAPVGTGDAPRTNSLSELLLSHGLIRTLYKTPLIRRPWGRGRRGPSYIPANIFAVALLDTIAPQSASSDPIGDVQALISEANLPLGTKNALLALAKGAGEERDALRTSIETWFDGMMDRVSGWYKRKTQLIICLLSVLVTIGLNVNTVNVADRLIDDDAVRAAVVQQAVKRAGGTQDPQKTAQEVARVKELGIPLGWPSDSKDPISPKVNARTIVGWLLTFLALSLGAPFWFDALGRLADLRNSGPKPDKASAL